jgi:ATP-dependent Lhr-like helicase
MTTSPPSSSESDSRGSGAFGRLHERVQRWIWEHQWSELRDVQEQTIHAVLDSTNDLVVAAATAGGKTEAAFLPICSRLVGAPATGVQVLYVSPLKALINDQHGRLEDLCETLEIPVHRWHGDVDSGKKRQLLKDPRGILLITPESLEAFFVLRGSEIGTVFSGLEYVVLDEVHAFMGTERGRQVQSLLHRLELALRRRVRRIGLSATIGDMDLARQFLRPVGGVAVQAIVSNAEGQALQLQLRGYERPGRASLTPAGDDEDDFSIADDLFRVLRGTHNLVFANRRIDVELFADLLRRRCEALRVPNEFQPHHGNLARDLRQDVEAMLKDRSRPATAICTSTLELGIDIGSVSSVAQIGSPPSVASLRQRLGRSGRRGDPAVLRVYVREDALSADSPPQDVLRLELVETIAIVELLLRRWYEPPVRGRLHLSTLVQQTMSVIAQHGGVRAAEAYDALCRNGPFQGVSPAMFASLLRALGSHDLLMQGGDGTLLLGSTGERLVNHYDFYAAFTSPEEYRIVNEGRPLGTLPITQPLIKGTPLIFAGRRWKVTAVDPRQRVVDVVASPAGRPPRFGGEGGEVHDEVRAEMLRLLGDARVPIYLDEEARLLLQEGRDNFARMGLSTKRLVRAGSKTYLFPWAGDRTTNTLAVHLRALEFEAEVAHGIVSVADAPMDALTVSLRRLAEAGPVDPEALAAAVLNKESEKYDAFLDEPLLCAEYARRALDAEGASRAIKAIIASGVDIHPQ